MPPGFLEASSGRLIIGIKIDVLEFIFEGASVQWVIRRLWCSSYNCAVAMEKILTSDPFFCKGDRVGKRGKRKDKKGRRR